MIQAVRKEIDKEKRNTLKRETLPGVVFGSEPQQSVRQAAVAGEPNGVLCLDFDDIPADTLEAVKLEISAVPYVFAAGLSASNTGIFALTAYEGTPDLKTLIGAMQADFSYTIDKKCSDLCRLRFVTLDPDLIIKDEVVPATLSERVVPGSCPEIIGATSNTA